MKQSFRSGYASIIGRANVGKSTLLNTMLDEKVSIVTRKPQTTRHHCLGIHNLEHAQIVFIDTPGIQKTPRQAINQYMNRQAAFAMQDVDVLLFMVEALKWKEQDEHVLNLLQSSQSSAKFLVINKADKAADKTKLLPFIESLQAKTSFDEIFPISAKNKQGIQALEQAIIKYLPANMPIYPADVISDRNERFFAAEFLREKLMMRLSDELPYELTITIDDFKEKNDVYHIYACIWVEKASQKNIVIGKQGEILKKAGKDARLDMEKLFAKKVNLKTWVKIKKKWTDSEQELKLFGYDN